jgi:hypothetical protein
MSVNVASYFETLLSPTWHAPNRTSPADGVTVTGLVEGYQRRFSTSTPEFHEPIVLPLNELSRDARQLDLSISIATLVQFPDAITPVTTPAATSGGLGRLGSRPSEWLAAAPAIQDCSRVLRDGY